MVLRTLVLTVRLLTLVVLLAILFLGWQIYNNHFRPEQIPDGPTPDSLIAEMASDLAPFLILDGPILISAFENDAGHAFTSVLAATLQPVRPGGQSSRIVQRAERGGEHRPVPEDLPWEIRGAIRSDAAGVPPADQQIAVEFLDRRSGEQLFAANYPAPFVIFPEGGDPASPRSFSAVVTPIGVWAGLVLLVPLVSLSLQRRLVRRRSNQINAAMLLAFTACNALFGSFLLPLGGFGFPMVLFSLMLLALAFLYNVMIMTKAVQLESI